MTNETDHSMPTDQRFKVVRRIPQITGNPGAILYVTQPYAGPFESQAAARRWIENNRPLGMRLDVEPIIIEQDEPANNENK